MHSERWCRCVVRCCLIIMIMNNRRAVLVLCVVALAAFACAEKVCADGECHDVEMQKNIRDLELFEDSVCGDYGPDIEWEDWDEWLASLAKHRRTLKKLRQAYVEPIGEEFVSCVRSRGCPAFPEGQVNSKGEWVAEPLYLDNLEQMTLGPMRDADEDHALCLREFVSQSFSSSVEAVAEDYTTFRPWMCEEEKDVTLYNGGREGGWGIAKGSQHGDDLLSYGQFDGGYIAGVRNAYLYRAGKEMARAFDCDRVWHLSPGWKQGRTRGDSALGEVTKARDVEEALVLYGNKNALSYGQVLMWEIIPQLLAYADFLESRPNMHIITLHPITGRGMTNEVLSQWLAILGIPRSRLIYLKKDPETIYRVKQLYLPSPPETWFVNPGLLKMARESVFRRFGLAPTLHERGEEGHILLVRRCYTGMSRRTKTISDDVARGIKNFDELVEGVKAAFPGEKVEIFGANVGQEDTVRLFNNAKVIVSPHGGGSFNVMWAPSDGFMVEVLPESQKMMTAYHLASTAGVGWLGIVPDGSVYQEPFVVDVDDVVRQVALGLDGFQQLAHVV